jgi:antitoxin (DNA-binding transcriptional repressor) of toxin-antitoxin stability system
MQTVTVHVAKNTLSPLLVRVGAGGDIVHDHGKIAGAKLLPFQPPASKRQFGQLHGIICVGEAFFDPLPEEEVTAWK